MNSLFILIPVTFVLLAIAIGAWFWCVRNDQFEDLDAESQRILLEDTNDPRDRDETRP